VCYKRSTTEAAHQCPQLRKADTMQTSKFRALLTDAVEKGLDDYCEH
jgi:hypothetical protein